jgi:hypothetical protein
MIETLCRIIISFAFTLIPFQAFAFLYQSKFSDPFYVLFNILALVFFYFVASKIEPIALKKTYYISLSVHLFLASPFIAFQIFLFFIKIFSNDSFIRLISSGDIFLVGFPLFILTWILFFLAARFGPKQKSGIAFLIYMFVIYLSSFISVWSMELLPGIHQ